MPPDDLQRIKAIFLEAVEKTGSEREAFLQNACGADTQLLAEVLALLEASDRAGQFLASPTQEPPHATVAQIEERPGTRIGPYKLLEQIGEGGFGLVFMAEQESPVRRRVALKIIKLGMDTKQVIARFEAERQALAMMDHPNIAKVFDAGTTQTGRPYFVMELVRGMPITEYCDSQKLSTRQRVELFIQVCHAIQHAHQKGIIHRDIKPNNVLVTMHDDKAVPKVIDFGIAKATATPLTEKTLFTEFRQFMGTPAYMSPEQAQLNELDVDTRSDVYSLGVLIYELLTGSTPFSAKELKVAAYDEIRRIIRDVDPPRPSTRLSTMAHQTLTMLAGQRQTDPKRLRQLVRGDLDWIVMKCLEKDRKRRYETANALAMDVQRHLNNEPIIARPSSALYRFRKTVSRNRLAFGAVAAVVLVLILGICGSTWQAVRAARARDAAEAAEQEEERLRLVADEERVAAQKAQVQAQREQAIGLVTEADALQMAGRWWEARRSMENAYALSVQAHVPLIIPRLGLFDLYSRSPPSLMTYTGHGAGIHCLAVSPDRRTVISGSYDNTLALWDIATGRILRTFHGHTGGVVSVAWSPDGRSVVSSSNDHTVKLWDVSSGRLLRTFPGHTDNVTRAVFTPDGRTIISFGCDATIRFWDLASGSELRRLRAQGDIWYGNLSPDGRTIAASGDAFVQLWDAASGRLLRGISDENNVLDVEFSSDGKEIATASGDMTVKLMNVETGELIRTLSGHTSAVICAVFSSDGKRILSSGNDHTARLWDADTGELLHTFVGHSDGVPCAVFMPDGKTIMTSGYDGTLRRWNIEHGADMRPLYLTWPEVRAAAFSPDGRVLFTGNVDECALWDAATGRRLCVFPAHICGSYDAGFSPDGRSVVYQVDYNQVGIWDIAAARRTRLFANKSGDGDVAVFSPDGRSVVTGGRDMVLRRWDVATGKLLCSMAGHRGEISSAAFTMDGRFLVSGSADGMLKLWDIAKGKELRAFTGHHYAKVHCLAITRDGRLCLSGSLDRTLILWDLTTGQAIRTLTGHTDDVRGLVFSPDETMAYSVSLDNTIKLWDIATGRVIHSINSSDMLNCMAISPDQNKFATGGKYGTVWLSDLNMFDEFQQYQPRLEQAQRALQENPDDPDALATLGQWWLLRGMYDAAVDCLEKARAGGSAISSLALGRSYWSARRFDDARREFSAALAGCADPQEQFYLRTCLKTIEASALDAEAVHQVKAHVGSVDWVAFSRDGRKAMSCGDDGRIILWDTATQSPLRTVATKQGQLAAVAFSPDGQSALSAGGDMMLKLWDLQTGQLIRAFAGHAGAVQSVAFSPDGKTALSGGNDKTVILWDVATGNIVRRFVGHGGGVNAVIFSPDGKSAISGSDDFTARIWDLATGKKLRTLAPHYDAVLALAVSQDGRLLLSGDVDWLMRVWDVATGQLLGPFIGNGGYVTGVAISPDGRTAYCSSVDQTVKSWDVATQRLLHIFDYGSRIECIDLSPDGRHLIAGDSAGYMWFRDLGGPAESANPDHPR